MLAVLLAIGADRLLQFVRLRGSLRTPYVLLSLKMEDGCTTSVVIDRIFGVDSVVLLQSGWRHRLHRSILRALLGDIATIRPSLMSPSLLYF